MFDKKLILTIDDADTIRSYLKSLLTPLGAYVEGASTGEEGLQMLAQKHFDIILLDLILPDADGIELLQRLRTQNVTSTIVMLTGHGAIKSAISAVQLGADGYIQKQELAAKVRDHSEFFFGLEQAVEHRAGLIAQKQLEIIRADFYSMVTHDLRSPTSIILTVLDLLAGDEATPLNVQQEKLVGMARNALSKMLYLITNYLDYAKIDAGYLRLEKTEVALNRLVEESVRLYIVQAEAKHQTLTLDLPAAPVMGNVDAERIRQVLDNLVSNACKYTPAAGQITVTLRLSGDAQHAIIQIRDTGIGIQPRELPTLFTKYHRVPGETTRTTMGTGLGLLIVKEIVEAHGGIVYAESDGIAGHGTTFTFEIPLTEQPAQQPRTEYLAETPERHALAQDAAEPDTERSEFMVEFVRESQGQIAALQEIFQSLSITPSDQGLIKAGRRIAHTLRGNAGAMQVIGIDYWTTLLEETLQSIVNGQRTLTTPLIADMENILQEIGSELAKD